MGLGKKFEWKKVWIKENLSSHWFFFKHNISKPILNKNTKPINWFFIKYKVMFFKY